MFALPDAKRVRRNELHSPSATPPSSPEPELQKILNARLAQLYGPPGPATAVVTRINEHDGDQNLADTVVQEARAEEEEGFAFRLFSTRAMTKKSGLDGEKEEAQEPVLRVMLGDEGGEGSGGFVVKGRDEGYYFAEKATGVRRARIEAAAVSGEQVRRALGVKYTGWAVPWRVRVLRISKPKLESRNEIATGRSDAAEQNLEGLIGGEEQGRRKRAGKKSRIVLRRKLKAADTERVEKEEERRRREMEDKEREEKWRENRTRKNRMKQIKKRAKEKTRLGMGVVEPGDSR